MKRIGMVRLAALILALAVLCSCAARKPEDRTGMPDESTPGTEQVPEERDLPPEQDSPVRTDTADGEPDPAEQGAEEADEAPDVSEGEEDPSGTGYAAPAPEGHYTFRPKVCSVYMEEIFGREMCETWFNLVDAVMAGENTFACPDQHTYDWVMGQFPERCFPVLVGLIDYAYDREHSVIDGVASFTYLVPWEEVSARIASFAELVEGILNETMGDDYTDFEKALALYEYFSVTYEYDYDTYYLMNSQAPEDVTAISFLESGVGICQEISFAYSYLLMQAGVEATVMKGNRSYDREGHQWSYVRLNGKDYHIDPTYGLGTGQLCYFLMTDGQREEMDGYKKTDFVPCSCYAQDYPHPDYAAEDETFRAIWDYSYEYAGFDPERHILYCWEYVEDEDRVIRTFDYSGY